MLVGWFGFMADQRTNQLTNHMHLRIMLYEEDLALDNQQELICHKTIGGYLMPNPLYTYIINSYDLAGLSFMADQPLEVI